VCVCTYVCVCVCVYVWVLNFFGDVWCAVFVYKSQVCIWLLWLFLILNFLDILVVFGLLLKLITVLYECINQLAVKAVPSDPEIQPGRDPVYPSEVLLGLYTTHHSFCTYEFLWLVSTSFYEIESLLVHLTFTNTRNKNYIQPELC
jgi:hypothetical protein